MSNENVPNEEQKVNEQKVNLEPIILGELKKDSAGRMGIVVVIFVLFLTGFIALPAIQEQLREADGFWGQLYDRFFGTETDVIVIGNDTIVTLNEDTEIRFDNIRLTNIEFRENTIIFYMHTTGETIDLDERDLYLEIYRGATDNFLKKFRLTGTINAEPQEMGYTFVNQNFNTEIIHYGRIQDLGENNNDEDGNNNEDNGNTEGEFNLTNNRLTCTLGIWENLYVFRDNALISLTNITTHHDADLEGEEELHASLFTAIRNAGGTAMISEIGDAVVILISIDLANFDLESMSGFEHHFFEYGKEARLVNQEMQNRGFECQ